ncbi:hypothetical protein O6H91_09G013800 [Diphasiastrum complanatum]|uniref:Uncharacterized protein n=1 Tax=Diphasiastrum complanatum TaxID=34168 RepID=A0ACC2CLK1_DIPCM|nr:hypothetical protein O6H91_09G013800 [Diphasiastrum complanatum]
MGKHFATLVALEESNMKQVLANYARMLDGGLHADLSIQTQNDFTLAHRGVLASISSVLQAKLEDVSSDEEQQTRTAVIKLDELGTTKAVRAFLRLLYTGSLDLEGISWEHILEIFAACHKFQVPVCMKQACASALGEMLTVHNCLRILEQAEMYDKALMKKSEKFVAKNFRSVVLAEGFEDLAKRKPAVLVDLVRTKMTCSAHKRICLCLAKLLIYSGSRSL